MVDFTASAEHKEKMKESEKRNKYLNFGRELKTIDQESNYNLCAWNNPLKIY